ncbi:MAG: rRNA maturation RNase YbeY [Egibacteraceae bacterium]
MTVYLADEQSRPLDDGRLQRLAEYVLADRQVPEVMELSVLCVEREVITRLNETHMGGEGATDVLAFPIDYPGETAPGQPALLGDVVLCPAVAAEQAERDGGGLHQEVELLLVHGILHLLGHDHAEPRERAVMFTLTDQLLAGFRAEDAGR